MRIGIYNEPSGGAIGGAESEVAIFAHALRGEHDVEIIHHRETLTSDSLAALSGVSLDGVGLRYAARQREPFGTSALPWHRYRAARAWQSALSRPYDLFINSTHGLPPFCQARRGMLVVLFPFFRPHYPSDAAAPDGTKPSPFWRAGRAQYTAWEWRQRMASYQVKAAISSFSRDWTRQLWGVECAVLYPPVDTVAARGDKSNVIVSVGRFSSSGVSKKQLEMVTAFRAISASLPHGWAYRTAGALDDSPGGRAYLESVRAAANPATQILVDLPRSAVKSELAGARIFWHAAGYGEDHHHHPERTEHFGIATVEAMAAGCVPVVIDKGAQPEIVEHGVNGFVWRTLDELRIFTQLLAEDTPLWHRMSAAARTRAAAFSRDGMIGRFKNLLIPILERTA